MAAIAVAGLWLRSRADPPVAPAPVSQTLLQQLSNETQQLYTQSCRSMVRVQLPAPQWLEDYNTRQRQINLQQLLDVWGTRLDPVAREHFAQELGRPATTQSATQSATQPFSVQLQMNVVPRPDDAPLALYAVGLLVDDKGHAVFPIYVDHKSLGDAALPAVTGAGEFTFAKFVGSDQRTNLTVLQLDKHGGVPAALGHRRPEDGVLTMAIAHDGSAKLVVWSNQHPEPGFAILTDGSMAGFGFNGYFLGASQAKPVVDQLIATGQVHRALLGVLTREVGKEDPLRRQRRQLGTSPAIRILRVQNDSAASRGGLLPDDLILKIGDEPVGDAPTFAAVIASKSGETVLHVLRGEQMIERTVNLQPQ
jgi:hypothetical protein